MYFYTITKEFGPPDLVIDIGNVAKDWESAMLCHAGQMQTRGYVDLRLSAARHLGLSIGVEYAARHPERVSHLVLYGGYALGWLRRGAESVRLGRSLTGRGSAPRRR